jgi:hypothetical protein
LYSSPYGSILRDIVVRSADRETVPVEVDWDSREDSNAQEHPSSSSSTSSSSSSSPLFWQPNAVPPHIRKALEELSPQQRRSSRSRERKIAQTLAELEDGMRKTGYHATAGSEPVVMGRGPGGQDVVLASRTSAHVEADTGDEDDAPPVLARSGHRVADEEYVDVPDSEDEE